MAALAVAQRLMTEHDIDEADLAAGGERVTFEHRICDDRDGIRNELVTAVALFCQCRAWRSGFDRHTFCGLESDAVFVIHHSWLGSASRRTPT
jgi:hypothetical protein